MPFSCYNTGNYGATVNNFSFYFGVNYTRLHSNGINELTEEKGCQWGMDERRDGSVACNTDLRQISAVWDSTEYHIHFECLRSEKHNPASALF